MSLTFKVDEGKMTRAFAKWQKEFGDSNRQAVARLAVSMARVIATDMYPGKGAKGIITGAIVKDAYKNVVAVTVPTFKALEKENHPGMKIGNRWIRVKKSNLLRSPAEIDAFIEKHRSGSDGRVKWVPPTEKGICRKKDMTDVLKKRKLRAGIAKGSILGAGMRAARYQRGGRRISIGKNVMSWAQKHADFGTASRKGVITKPTIDLVSLAKNTLSTRILPDGIVKPAAETAWKRTTRWYLYALKQIDK